MTRNIDLFRQLPYELRRYIVLLMRRFSQLGYTLMRPRALDLRFVRPVNDFAVIVPTAGSPGQWLGLDYDERILFGYQRNKRGRVALSND